MTPSLGAMETNPFRAKGAGDGAPGSQPGRSSATREGAPADAGGSSLGRVVADRVSGSVWWYRAPVVVVLTWMAHGYLTDPMHSSIFHGINLGFHEAGHAALMWFGSTFWTTAGGTLFEIGVPLVAGVYLWWRQRDPFGATVCLFWVGTALFGVGIYAADARAQALPLVSPFGPVDPGSHDWTAMLMRFGKLSKDVEIGAMLQTAGKAAMVTSLIAGAWVLRVMARTTRASGPAGTLWDPAEDARLASHLSGEPLHRPTPRRVQARKSEEERFMEFMEKDADGPEPR